MSEPQQRQYCSPETRGIFRAELAAIDTVDGLMRCAVAVSKHALNDVSLEDIQAQLERMVTEIQARVARPHPTSLITHLHAYLFEELDFRGDGHAYYSPLNSYLPAILQRRRGIPVTLSLLYVWTANRLGLRAEGVNAPGHFLTRVWDERHPMLVCPFHGGRLLTEAEAIEMIQGVVGPTSLEPKQLLRRASHRDWLERIIANLEQVFRHSNHWADYYAMKELRLMLHE